MPQNEDRTCIICNTKNPMVETYGEWVCSCCSAEYEYEEGHQLILNDRQRLAIHKECLRKKLKSLRINNPTVCMALKFPDDHWDIEHKLMIVVLEIAKQNDDLLEEKLQRARNETP